MVMEKKIQGVCVGVTMCWKSFVPSTFPSRCVSSSLCKCGFYLSECWQHYHNHKRACEDLYYRGQADATGLSLATRACNHYTGWMLAGWSRYHNKRHLLSLEEHFTPLASPCQTTVTLKYWNSLQIRKDLSPSAPARVCVYLFTSFFCLFVCFCWMPDPWQFLQKWKAFDGACVYVYINIASCKWKLPLRKREFET